MHNNKLTPDSSNAAILWSNVGVQMKNSNDHCARPTGRARAYIRKTGTQALWQVNSFRPHPLHQERERERELVPYVTCDFWRRPKLPLHQTRNASASTTQTHQSHPDPGGTAHRTTCEMGLPSSPPCRWRRGLPSPSPGPSGRLEIVAARWVHHDIFWSVRLGSTYLMFGWVQHNFSLGREIFL